jgi:hypothetical protein
MLTMEQAATLRLKNSLLSTVLECYRQRCGVAPPDTTTTGTISASNLARLVHPATRLPMTTPRRRRSSPGLVGCGRRIPKNCLTRRRPRAVNISLTTRKARSVASRTASGRRTDLGATLCRRGSGTRQPSRTMSTAAGWAFGSCWMFSQNTSCYHVFRAGDSERGRIDRALRRWAAGGVVLSPSERAHARAPLVQDGGFIYDSDGYNNELPYYVSVFGRPWLVGPYATDTKRREILPGARVRLSVTISTVISRSR